MSNHRPNETIVKLLGESEIATMGRRLAIVDEKINGSKQRCRLIHEDLELQIVELNRQIEHARRLAEDHIVEERKVLRGLRRQQSELIQALSTNVARVPAPDNGRVEQVIVYDDLPG